MPAKKKSLPARPRIMSPAMQITRDEQLRKNINSFVAENVNELDDTVYQYKLSKLLCLIEDTDTGNAIRFASRYGHLCKFIPEREKWYVWNGGAWSEDNTGLAIQYAKKTAAYIEMESSLLPSPMDATGQPLIYPDISEYAVATPAQQKILDQFAAYEEEQKTLYAWYKSSRSKRGLLAMLELTRAELGITMPREMFDADDLRINLRNGIYNLRENKFEKHDKNHLMIRQANVDYDPYATCPQWMAFIQKITVNRPSIARFIQQIAGMGLTGERIEDIFVVFWGDGSNGKTVLFEVLREMLGTYATVATQNMFMERNGDAGDFENSKLIGIRMLFKDETKQGKQLDVSMVKTLTGGAPISACFKFKDYFDFMPKFTAILATNHLPRITENSNGIWRRIKNVPFQWNFDNDPDKKDKPTVLAELREESAGIFNWALAGFYDYKTNGVQVPAEIIEATKEYKKLSDIIGQFFAEECYIPGINDDANTFCATKKEMYERYKAYMDDAGSHPLNKPNFGEEMRRLGYKDGKTGLLGHFWRGIRLREKDEAVQMPTEELAEQEKQETEVF